MSYQQSNFEKRLSRRIWRRKPNDPCRFWFCKDQAPHFLIESLGKKGSASYVAQIKQFKSSAPSGAKPTLGGIVLNKELFMKTGHQSNKSKKGWQNEIME